VGAQQFLFAGKPAGTAEEMAGIDFFGFLI
jgi:hypothetical protein